MTQQSLFDIPPRRWVPHEYQQRSVDFLLNRGSAALFLDPGLGKSSITLQALTTLKAQGLMTRTLLLAPLRVVYSVWPQEIQKWEQFSGLRFTILHGPRKGAALLDDSDIFLMNYDGVRWLMDDERTFRRLGFDTLVCDELSKLKHGNTQRFKSLKRVLPTFSRRWGLTGSPASNGLLDLWGQCYVLDQGRSLTPYITQYRSKYFIPTGFQGYDWKLRPGADREIYERIAPLALRIGAKDNLDLPDLVSTTISVELPPPAMKSYKQMEAVLIANVNENIVVASNAAAASSKCRQIANGGVYYEAEDGRKAEQIHSAKTDALCDLVEELQGNPLLVAYEFTHDLERLKQALGPDTPYIGGGISAKVGAGIVGKWNRGEIPVLLAHPATIAHGVNLQQAGNHICWHSIPWDFEHYLQMIARIWRQGSTAKRVFVHHIVAKGTIDEVVMKVLAGKERTQTALFDALKALTID